MEVPANKRGSPVTLHPGKRRPQKKGTRPSKRAGDKVNALNRPPSRQRDVRLDMTLQATSAYDMEPRHTRAVKDNPRGNTGNSRGITSTKRSCVTMCGRGKWNMICTLMYGVWLVVLTVFVAISFHTVHDNTVHVTDKQLQKHVPQPTKVPGSGDTLHHYPFNIYDAAPGHVMRYPATTDSGIPHLTWSRLTWYTVCCKQPKATQCFPPQHTQLRHDAALDQVFLELVLDIANDDATNDDMSATRLMGASVTRRVGARCHLYWYERHYHDNGDD